MTSDFSPNLFCLDANDEEGLINLISTLSIPMFSIFLTFSITFYITSNPTVEF